MSESILLYTSIADFGYSSAIQSQFQQIYIKNNKC